MRRGLLSWDEVEVPAAVLDARVARCRDAMTADGLDALLLYNNFPRPAAVSWLTHFVPYWSQGVLVLPREGSPEYFVSLSKRVAGWIDETSHMGEIVSTPRLGADLAKRLSDTERVGIVELGRLPGGVGRPLSEALKKTELIDATALFRSVRHPADDAEIAITRSA
ncbi:MAG: aminopeptidase P family N-terminal domain-containing protein, partial [Alphaproteobacteria bacterium]